MPPTISTPRCHLHRSLHYRCLNHSANTSRRLPLHHQPTIDTTATSPPPRHHLHTEHHTTISATTHVRDHHGCHHLHATTFTPSSQPTSPPTSSPPPFHCGLAAVPPTTTISLPIFYKFGWFDSFPPGSDDTDFNPEGDLRLIKELLNNDPSYPLPLSHNPLSGSTTSSSPDHLLKEFADELALITFPPRNDDLPFDIESDLREIEYLLNHDLTKEIDSILEDSVDECNPNNDLVDTIPEMFTDEHTLDYSSPPLYDDVYDDPFDSKEDKIKESKLLIDELDPPRSSDFLISPKCDSVLYEDFSEVDAFPSTNNEDKVFNPGILIHENLFEVTIKETPDKNLKKISISNASLILEDFNPPLYEIPFHKVCCECHTPPKWKR
ncbi:hypothetical protein Tco_0377444 [Tanacetum coccineum]